MDVNGIKLHIREYLQSNLFYSSKLMIADNDSFLEKGIIDSTGILEIINFVQEKFGFSVDDEEIVPENFDSIDCIANFIAKKGN